jgi:glycosyltransferase involved in cell wall biosynthesis
LFDGALWFAVPGDIDGLTGGTLYDKRILAEFRALGQPVHLLSWAASFPLPGDADLRAAAADLAACPEGALVMIDGLAFGAMPDVLLAEAERLRLAALVHHPLALETGLDDATRDRLRESEQRALTAARAVIVTSDMTAATLVESYAVDPARITVAKPGVDRPPAIRRTEPPSGQIRLLSIGNVMPRKGFDVLVDALSRMGDLDWRCAIAGSLERSPETAAALATQIAACGLGSRITLVGERSDLAPLYRGADIFVLASRYEGYGMVFAEALSYGLPIVGTAVGAIPDVVPPAAGILVPADDPRALAQALRAVMTEPGLRQGLAQGAMLAADSLPRWPDSATRIASALHQIEDQPVRRG